MKNLTKFQIVFLGIFVGFIVFGVMIFAIGRTSKTADRIDLTIWGTMSASNFNKVLEKSGLNLNEEIRLVYEQKNAETFDFDFLEALAQDIGPDMFFIPSDSVLKYEDKALLITFKSYSEKTFKNSFVEGAEIFLKEDGIIALPVFVDPLVMYWNRELFNNAGIISPPKFWDQLYDMGLALTKKESNLNLMRSAVALGEFGNINNAFEILSVLFMQAGNPITERVGGKIQSALGKERDATSPEAERALSFYTEFSNPLKTFYSWNRSLPWSRNHFIAGDLAIYFGFASELFEIREKNPNLNFDVAALPQSKESELRINYGKIEGIAISKKTAKVREAFKAVALLSGSETGAAFSEINNLPPVRRDLLSGKPDRAFMEVFYDEALISKGWLIPDKTKTIQIFKEMIESVSGGRERVQEAINKADNAIRLLFR